VNLEIGIKETGLKKHVNRVRKSSKGSFCEPGAEKEWGSLIS
jgi:hypothetical protein